MAQILPVGMLEMATQHQCSYNLRTGDTLNRAKACDYLFPGSNLERIILIHQARCQGVALSAADLKNRIIVKM